MDFDIFWQVYPKRRGCNPKRPALEKWERAIARGANPEEIIEGAKIYAAECDEDGTTGSPYVCHARTWLHQERWKDHLGARKERAESRARMNAEKMRRRAWWIKQGRRMPQWTDEDVAELLRGEWITQEEAYAVGLPRLRAVL